MMFMSFMDRTQENEAERGEKERGYLTKVKEGFKLIVPVINGTYLGAVLW